MQRHQCYLSVLTRRDNKTLARSLKDAKASTVAAASIMHGRHKAIRIRRLGASALILAAAMPAPVAHAPCLNPAVQHRPLNDSMTRSRGSLQEEACSLSWQGSAQYTYAFISQLVACAVMHIARKHPGIKADVASVVSYWCW